MNWIFEPWPWYIGGPMIAFVLMALLFVGKSFGMSSNLRTICAICGAGKSTSFFNYDWKSQRWNLIVVLGAVVGGWLGSHLLSNTTAVTISEKTITKLQGLGIQSAGNSYLPEELFAMEALQNPLVLLSLALGGFLVGFGARYAGGCTSGHAISGLSNLQFPSLIAVIGFFIGGLTMINFIFPLIF